MTPRTRVVGYIRVSTEEQAREGVSLAAQRARINAQAVASDLKLVTTYEDPGASAKTLARPGLSAALAALDTGQADGLLIFKLDRLTRNVANLGHLIERYFASRFALLSVSDAIDTRSAGGRLVLTVLVSVAQWEREAIAERTAAALAHIRGQGVRLGGEGLGWHRTADTDSEGRRIVKVERAELAAVERIGALRRSSLSLREICTRLEAEGYKTKRGGKWAPKTVRAVLLRLDEQRAA
jgi:DNA invertase Pin-like site-specific DNA recombinase